ncbi:MAG: serine hydrolase domain-containing protein [Thermoguttaceae bacterium]
MKLITFKTVAVALACAGLLASAVLANDAVDACAKKEIDQGMFLGAVVVVGQPGKILFCKAYGQRDVGKPMTTDCLFDIASVTKVTTVATALAITLHRHPEISLDDPMQKYLPGMTGKGADAVTIRNMAMHRSGLDNTKTLHAKYQGEELVKQILMRDNQWAVGSRWKYSCLGMIRLGEMIASINQTEFGDFCKENIFVPLGMTDTCFSPVPANLRSRCVTTTAPLGIVSDLNAQRIGRPVGNAGVFSTAQDLAKLATLWLQKGEYGGKCLFSTAIYDEFTGGSIVWQTMDEKVFPLPNNVSPGSFYHSGHTGQLLIVDPKRNAYVIVLTVWLHPAIKASFDDGRKARGRLAGVVIDSVLGDGKRKEEHD